MVLPVTHTEGTWGPRGFGCGERYLRCTMRGTGEGGEIAGGEESIFDEAFEGPGWRAGICWEGRYLGCVLFSLGFSLLVTNIVL